MTASSPRAPSSYDKKKVDACYDYAVYFLSEITEENVNDKAKFWCIDIDSGGA
jgi:hypothetical protein